MRLVDEIARLWNDTLIRMPQSAWSWPVLAAAAAGGLVIVIGVAAAERPTRAHAGAAMTVVATPAGCEGQTWPYYSGTCLRGGRSDGVRVLQHEPALAAAAINATPWAPKATPSSRQASSRQQSSRHRQATHEPERTVTVRSGGRGRERTYVVPAEAFSAYGSARR